MSEQNNTNTVPDATSVTPLNEILTSLQALSLDTGFDVFIPSLQKNIKFKLLSTKQLKRLLQTVVDSPVYTTQFTLTFNSIIKENILDTSVNVDNLTIYDKLLILIKTRIESVSNNLTVKYTSEENQQYNLPQNCSFTYDLLKNYQNFTDTAPSFDKQAITHNNYTCVCMLPTIKLENTFEKELHKNIKIDINTPEELRDIIGDTFINEITKYIHTLSTDSNQLELSQYTFKDRIKIVENLPVPLINKVLKYIEQYREIIKNLITVSTTPLNKDNETVVIVKDIPLDATLFNM